MWCRSILNKNRNEDLKKKDVVHCSEKAFSFWEEMIIEK